MAVTGRRLVLIDDNFDSSAAAAGLTIVTG